MADQDAQGYLRPFTVDEEHSMGVTFPNQPAIRAISCRYDHYLGEPFCGVVIPHLVRAVGVNKTGCLKLGINYLISVKAIDEAKEDRSPRPPRPSSSTTRPTSPWRTGTSRNGIPRAACSACATARSSRSRRAISSCPR